MGKIRIELPDLTFDAQIAGDTPTIAEKLRIVELIGKLRSEKADRTKALKREQSENIDTRSGIRNAKLRFDLGFAENQAEEEQRLKQNFNLLEEDYFRDDRGRLGLNVSGAKKIGVDIEKPTLIDEVGFSKYDFADLSGITPELGGGIAGAVAGGTKGAAIGTALFPGIGTAVGGLFGSAIGAGLGAGGGKAAEELVETTRGLQKQPFSEVATDVGKEAAITFGIDLTLGLPFLAYRGIAKAFGGGKKPTEAELETIGSGLESTITKKGGKVDFSVKPKTDAQGVQLRDKDGKLIFEKDVEVVDTALKPTLGTVGAPSLLGRAAGIAEKIFGTSKRLQANDAAIRARLDAYKQIVGEGASAEDIGQMIVEASDETFKKILGSQKKAQDVVLNQLDDLLKDMGAATSKNANLSEEALDFLQTAYIQASKNTKDSTDEIAAILNQTPFQNAVIPTTSIRDMANDIIKIKRNTPANADFLAIAKVLREYGKKGRLSFNELLDLRRDINVLKQMNHSVIEEGAEEGATNAITQAAYKHIDNVVEKIDELMTPRNVEDLIRNFDVTEGGQRIGTGVLKPGTVQTLNDKLVVHRDLVRNTNRIFTQMESAAALKNFRTSGITGSDVNADYLINNLVKEGQPSRLRKAIDAVAEGDISGFGNAEQFRELLAGQWLRNAMTEANIGSNAAGKFNGLLFQKKIERLGKTADVLFGNNTAKIKELSDKIAKTNFNDLTSESIKDIWQQEKGIIRTLNDVLTAANEEAGLRSLNLFQKIRTNQIGDLEAAKNFLLDTTKTSEIKRIVQNVSTEQREKIKGFYLKQLVGDFGSTQTTDAAMVKKFASSLIDQGQAGKLAVLFGDDMAKDMLAFGKQLDLLARKNEGGDLIAANIAASPIQNIGSILRFAAIGQVLGMRRFYKDVFDDYVKLQVANKKAKVPEAALFGKAISNAIAAIIPTLKQTPQQVIRDVGRGAREQIQSYQESREQDAQPDDQLSQIQENMPAPNINSGIAQVNVTQPNNRASIILNPNPQTRFLAEQGLV